MRIKPPPTIQRLLAALGVLCSVTAICHAQMPTTPTEVSPGIIGYQANVTNSVGANVNLWIFLPESSTGKVGCVLIAPAGTACMNGSDVGSLRECLPYVRAGFAVVSYSLDGPVADLYNVPELLAGYQKFKKTGGGLIDEYSAQEYIAQHLAQVDPKRIYAAGHSSAGTVALLVAEYDPRIKACIAYAPRTDLVNEMHELADLLHSTAPDVAAFFAQTSPTTWVKKLKCPLFLFSAADDSIVEPESVARFDRLVSKTNPNVIFSRVATGDHYDSMIQQGIPRGIAWLKIVDQKIQARE